MSNLILLIAAAFMVVTGIYLGQQGLALARANKALRKVIASMDRVEALEKLLADAKRMAEFGDINEDMEDDGIGWKQWYLDVIAILGHPTAEASGKKR